MPGQGVGAQAHLAALPDDGVVQCTDSVDGGVVEDDGRLHARVLQSAAPAERAERAHVAVLDDAPGTDDRRTDEDRALDARARLDHDGPVHPAERVDGALDAGFDGLQQDAVAVEEVVQGSGVLPEPRVDRAAHVAVVAHQPLDRVRDLQLAPPAGLGVAHGLVDLRGEAEGAGDGEVAAGPGGLLLQGGDPVPAVQFGDAVRAGVGDLRQQQLGRGPVPAEGLQFLADAGGEDVVAQVHHEVVVGEEVAGDQDTVRQARGESCGR